MRDDQGGESHAAVTKGLAHETAARDIRDVARVNGLEISDADARDLQPYYDQQRRWLADLRLVLGDEEEPATGFSAVGAHDASA